MISLLKNRFDILFKLLFLNPDVPYPIRTSVYKQHLYIITEGKYTEPDHSLKSAYIDYEVQFQTLFQDVAENRFDWQTSGKLPVSQGGILLNGAHRYACHLALNKKIQTEVRLGAPDVKYDAQYFIDHGMCKSSIFLALQEFLKLYPKSQLSIVWPRGQNLSNLYCPKNEICRLSLKVSKSMLREIVRVAYNSEHWINSGVDYKLANIASNFNNKCTVIVSIDSQEEITQLKKSFRNQAKCGKHSVHTTDNILQASTLLSYLQATASRKNWHNQHHDLLAKHNDQNILFGASLFLESRNNRSLLNNWYIQTRIFFKISVIRVKQSLYMIISNNEKLYRLYKQIRKS